ncbi:MAG: hypothetical protein UY05_C0016G0011 [Candidatus Peregrinibacteria bacterium GW2011_GWA2_47_7]|nr:MAG: hypothetical protein UY05_C0016G0011 [Candidatus Peregrinibacteria bacterium GW2011_GWA2_47_7]
MAINSEHNEREGEAPIGLCPLEGATRAPIKKPLQLDLALGGQAVIEGVMIRSPHFITIALRKKNGEIKIKKESFISLSKKIPILGLPVVRGIVTIFEMMIIGMKAINYSAEESLEDDEETPHAVPPQKTKLQNALDALSFGVSIVISLAFALFLFKFVPLFITTQLEKIIPVVERNFFIFNSIDGVIRISLFLLYVYTLSKWRYFSRVFEYHGAEHQAVFAYEKGKPLTPEHVGAESPCHPRCGTSFIMVVLVVSIVFFTFMPKQSTLLLTFLYRLSIVPLIAAVGYEILKWSAKYQNHFITRLISKPGLLTQRITTARPDEQQIEVAIAAVQTAVDLENERKTT